jgi:tetratricopeptide (TPR) repeat protein
MVHGSAGLLEESAAAAERAVEYAVAAGEKVILGQAATGYASVSLHGPQPAAAVAQRCAELLALLPGTNRKTEAVILSILAQLRAMDGAIDEGRVMAGRARQLLLDLGPSRMAFSTSTESARIEILAGDLPAAEALLQQDNEALENFGERYYRSTVVAMLANVVAEQERGEEASKLADLAAKLASEDDAGTLNLVRMARARAAALRGDLEEATRAAEEAVEVAPGGIYLADARTLLGELLIQAGRHDQARPHLETALGLYGTKGERVSVERVSGLLASVPSL